MSNHNERKAIVDADRRRMLTRGAQAAGAVSLVGLLLGSYAEQAASRPIGALRPPGALAEDDFLGACVRCGLCVRDCPYDTLKLAPFGASLATGTPYFVARDVPCYMCKDIPCVAACPTDALSKQLTDIRDADMGVAVVVGTDTCYSINGIAHCQACYLACPIKDEAITMEMKQDGKRVYFEPTVHREHCTGCGKCEKDCVVEQAAIKVLPRALVRHDLGLNPA
ncbi:MAG: ferredoxin-type protein NapG [Proteobacteria bacterium]|nr:ferredoxin-type protein NapG [Pseudomonadota bacterium]